MTDHDPECRTMEEKVDYLYRRAVADERMPRWFPVVLLAVAVLALVGFERLIHTIAGR